MPGPSSASSILEVCNKYESSPDELYRLICMDPVLLSRLLEVTNSVFSGLEQPVTSPARAIIMLGMNTVKALAVSAVGEH